MAINLELEYTPRSPRRGLPFTESSYVRASSPYTFDIGEIGVALVDLWNFGWDDGPVTERLGWELSTERGVSHALRKKAIIQSRIAPTIDILRMQGVQIFHCNHARFLQRYPQWLESTTDTERSSIGQLGMSEQSPQQSRASFPDPEWVSQWRQTHADDVFNLTWSDAQADVYDDIRIPLEVGPHERDILIYGREQFHRILTARKIKVLFYMGFETDECVMNSSYGISAMHAFGYMTNIVRDCTCTYESADTRDGLWRTRVAIEQIEKRWGYSVASDKLIDAVQGGCHES